MTARFLLSLFAVLAPRAFAAVDGGAADFSPKTYAIERYQHIWKRSPFIVETKEKVHTTGLAQKYALLGIAMTNRVPTAILRDNTTQNRIVVTKGVNTGTSGLEVIAVWIDRDDPSKSYATVRQNGQQASLPLDLSSIPKAAPLPVSGTPQIPGMPPGISGNRPAIRFPSPPPAAQPAAAAPPAAIPPPPPSRRIIRNAPVNVN